MRHCTYVIFSQFFFLVLGKRRFLTNDWIHVFGIFVNSSLDARNNFLIFFSPLYNKKSFLKIKNWKYVEYIEIGNILLIV